MPLVPHCDHGDPDCCGLILPLERGALTDLVCNECDAVLRTVPTSEAQQILAEMAATEICSDTCPHCGGHNVFSGFSSVAAYVCRHCGEGVSVSSSTQ